MGKQALYRKHRSKTLDEIVGQEHITDTLKNALKKGAISHAYLFTGPKGVGKTSIARILAHEINGIEYTDESTHLDIIEIDAASNRRIDEIRELRDKVHIAPTSSKYKVYIIDEVHMLTREAFNALLKTLEEPPKHAVFILATTESHKVPDTIMSRTQRFTFKPVKGEKAVEHLRNIAKTEGIVISDEALALLVDHGQGSFRDSISMLDQLSGLASDSYSVDDVQMLLGIPQADIVEALITSVGVGDHTQLFLLIRSLKEQGVDANRVARAMSRTLRESLVNDELLLEYETTLRLLSNLVGLTDANSDFLGLELALLNVMQPKANATPTPKKQPEKPEQKSTKQKDSEKETTNTDETVEKPEITEKEKDNSRKDKKQKTEEPKPDVAKGQIDVKPFDISIWKEMLDDVKAKHNTLYGLLRMAEPRVVEDELQLVFGFDFHKKQLESQKNKPIVRDYLTKYFGNAEFSAVVKKAANKPVEKPADKYVDDSKESVVDSVSNIFGSAELLD